MAKFIELPVIREIIDKFIDVDLFSFRSYPWCLTLMEGVGRVQLISDRITNIRDMTQSVEIV